MNVGIQAGQHIDALVRATGAADPSTAIRIKAREAIAKFREAFDDPPMPLDLDVLASLLGIVFSDDPAAHSDDAELVPIKSGRVAIRVNPDRPETRKRFSVAHEVSHTFFPNYQNKTWCRSDSRYRRRDNPNDLVEILCDIGASELILPAPWFLDDAAAVNSVDALVSLARKYRASREATLRRFAESHPGRIAAVFFSWKLKPVQQSTIGNIEQQDLFGSNPVELAHQAKRLRLDYSIPSASLADDRFYLPQHKSIASEGILYKAAATGDACEGECCLDLGKNAGMYRVMAVPVWTDLADLGPSGENAVCGIIQPLNAATGGNGNGRASRGGWLF